MGLEPPFTRCLPPKRTPSVCLGVCQPFTHSGTLRRFLEVRSSIFTFLSLRSLDLFKNRDCWGGFLKNQENPTEPLQQVARSWNLNRIGSLSSELRPFELPFLFYVNCLNISICELHASDEPMLASDYSYISTHAVSSMTSPMEPRSFITSQKWCSSVWKLVSCRRVS